MSFAVDFIPISAAFYHMAEGLILFLKLKAIKALNAGVNLDLYRSFSRSNLDVEPGEIDVKLHPKSVNNERNLGRSKFVCYFEKARLNLNRVRMLLLLSFDGILNFVF